MKSMKQNWSAIYRILFLILTCLIFVRCVGPSTDQRTKLADSLGLEMAIAGSFSLTGEKEAAPPEFYADAAVIAYMLPEGDHDLASLQPGITSSGGKFNLAALTDGDLATTALLPYTKPGENAWIQYEFCRPEAMQALTIVGGGSGGMFGWGADPGVKYFSGTGNYTNTINAPADWFKEGTQLWIDLGSVKNLAEVIINGKSLGIVWKTPFRLNMTEALKQGENTLEIKVTDLWVNRLIGDQQPGISKKITYTTMPFYRADSPLLPSGLLGPVKIYSITN